MKLIKVLAAACLALIGCLSVQAQEQEQGGKMPPRQPARPTTYELVDEVRNALGLDHKEFDKVYSAYEKYSKSVFGDESAAQPPRPEGRPGGGPGGFGGPGGGGRPPQGGPGGPGGRPGQGFGGQRPQGGNQQAVDVEKFEKTKTKAEEKLCKAMKKLFKKDTDKYNKWYELRQRQLEKMFRPQPPRPGDKRDEK